VERRRCDGGGQLRTGPALGLQGASEPRRSRRALSLFVARRRAGYGSGAGADGPPSWR